MEEEKKQKAKNLRVCVSGGHCDGKDPAYVEECYKLGVKIAKMGFRLDYGFSNSGVMGAVARGVLDNWQERKDKYYDNITPIVGVTTREYYELYEKDDILKQISEVVVEDTLENRKIKLLEADIVVFAPGGVGTLDELAYDCVAMQDGFLKTKPFIMYNINGFFYHILEYLKELAASGFRDTTRLALSNTDMACDMLKMNSKNITEALVSLMENSKNLLNDNYLQEICKIKDFRAGMYDKNGHNISD